MASSYADGNDRSFIYTETVNHLKKVCITMPMAKYLIAVVLRDDFNFQKSLKAISYHLRRNAASYQSYRRKKL